MANPAFKEFNAFWPFNDDDLDVLKSADCSLERFPESANVDQSEETNAGSANPTTPEQGVSDSADRRPISSDENTLDHENDIRYWRHDFESVLFGDDSASPNLDKLNSYIQEFREKKGKVDIGRITRFAVYRGFVDLVNHLVQEEGAELKQRDTLGRSAIFYAVNCQDLAMLEYVANKVSAGSDTALKELLNHQDAKKATPLHYAAKNLGLKASLANFEFCLTSGARPDVNLMTSLLEYRGDCREDLIRLLCTLYTKPESFLNYLIYVESRLHPDRSVSLFTFKELWTDRGILTEVQSKGELESSISGLTWIHLPWTNGVMLFKAFSVVVERVINREGSSAPENKRKNYLEFFHQCFLAPPIVPGDPDLNFREPTYELHLEESFDKALLVAIVFPCLVLEDRGSFEKSRDFHGRSRRSIHKRYATDLIQVERTLHEAYYPSLDRKALETRNENQVVTNECKKSAGESVPKNNMPILVVKQFWIWKIEDHILSAYSAPGKNPEDVLKYEFDSNYSYVSHRMKPNTYMFDNQKWKGEYIGVSTETFGRSDVHIGLLLANHIENFGKAQAEDKFQSPLDLFEIAIVHVLSRIDRYVTSSKSDMPKIKEERELMQDISNIRSELGMIGSILSQQKRILDGFFKSVNSDATNNPKWQRVNKAHQRLDDYLQRLEKIDRDAERAEKDIQDRLNLVRAHASIQTSRNSLALGTAVIGFTVITVIFAPLGFVTGLFGLPIDRFVKDKVKIDGTDTYGYSTKYVGKGYVAAELVSLAVTFILVLCLWLLGVLTTASDGPVRAKEKDSGRSADNAAGNDRRVGKPKENEKRTETKENEMMTGALRRTTNPDSTNLKIPRLRIFRTARDRSEKSEV